MWYIGLLEINYYFISQAKLVHATHHQPNGRRRYGSQFPIRNRLQVAGRFKHLGGEKDKQGRPKAQKIFTP